MQGEGWPFDESSVGEVVSREERQIVDPGPSGREAKDIADEQNIYEKNSLSGGHDRN